MESPDFLFCFVKSIKVFDMKCSLKNKFAGVLNTAPKPQHYFPALQKSGDFSELYYNLCASTAGSGILNKD